MKIIGLVGILTSAEKRTMWFHLAPAFCKEFNATFELEQAWYHVWSYWDVVAYGNTVVERHDTGEDLLLVGHSGGGLVAQSIAPKFCKSSVVGVVTINTPNSWPLLPDVLGCAQCTAPVVSFGATRDWMVPWGARHPRALRHRDLQSDHERDLIENKDGIADRIARISHEALTKARRE